MSANSHVSKQLAFQASKTIAAIYAADKAGDDTLSSRLADRLDSLASEVQWHPAGSREGALFQCAVLAGDIDSFDWIRIDGNYDSEARRAFERMARLTENVFVYLEQSTGTNRESLRLNYFSRCRADSLPPVIVPNAGPSPHVLAAIDVHRKVMEAMRSALDDNISDDMGDELHNQERKAMSLLIQCRTTSLDDVKAKASYLRSLDDEGDLSDEDFKKFATAMA